MHPKIWRKSAVRGATVARTRGHATSHGRADTGTGSRGHRMIGAEHTDARAKLGAAQGDHVLADVGRHYLAVLRAGVGEDVLDQIVAVLVAGNIDEGNARAIHAALADTVKVTAKKLRATNLETLLNHL